MWAGRLAGVETDGPAGVDIGLLAEGVGIGWLAAEAGMWLAVGVGIGWHAG